ncbi:MAG: stage II sporulation protein D [Paenibacillaceae bacterium]
MIMIQRQTRIRIAAWLGLMIICTLLTIVIAKISDSRHTATTTAQSQTTDVAKIQSPSSNTSIAASAQLYQSAHIVSIYLSQQQQITRVPLEQYIAGVVAAEMPVNFELEALKAQAMAARTYIVRRIVNHDRSGMPVKGAEVTDTVVHQAYLTDQQLKENWGKKNYQVNINKIMKVVSETRGLILTYNNQPINATYFSTSNGYTENSEDYWGVNEPYLRSVASPWDQKISPSFIKTIQIPYKQFLLKLGLANSNSTNKAIPASLSLNMKSTLELSQGQRIASINIAGKSFTGKDIRERLNLASSSFTWKRNGDTMEIQTWGSGHGVGMSQWGANGMAQEGKTASEIVQYYYKGIVIQSARNLLE